MTRSSPSQEVDSRFWFGTCPTVATFSLTGLALSALWYSITPQEYESCATITIMPKRNPASGFDMSYRPYPPILEISYRHDQLIGEDIITEKALTTHGLNELATLRDLPAGAQVHFIQANLEVQRIEGEDDMYRLRYRSRDIRDAHTVLATLVSTYEKYLDEKYAADAPVSPYARELLLEMKQRVAEKLATQIAQVQDLERQIASRQTSKGNSATLKGLQKQVELSQENLSLASSMLKNEIHFNGRQGFHFETTHPAYRGVPIGPNLRDASLTLLIGSGFGLLFGLIVAGFMTAVGCIRTQSGHEARMANKIH